MVIERCPNLKCESKAGSRFWIKKGFFVTKWNAQPVPRYRCVTCGRYFSSHTFRSTYRQKKPYLNEPIHQWYCSATTQRRMARVLRINRKTVVRKFLFMAQLAKAALISRPLMPLGAEWQFDEMESFEHSRLKPLSIALAVEKETGWIARAEVASFASKGKLAALARWKYGWRPDTRDRARQSVLNRLKELDGPITLTTDRHPAYPRLIRHCLPRARHLITASRNSKPPGKSVNRRNQNDPLFTFNYTAAKIRHDLSRMARKVWVTTKKAERLQAHLDLYVAYNNGLLLNAENKNIHKGLARRLPE